ncbi:hypothetical protein [Bordetella genomosp. 13]|uniref:hypothetical protein n=1 Tax=Bordetella genomosp. 13 TaxID=463040 RepID=UPI001642CD79|nr:hypothetical protein [Bordetella genomosp. 13]
MDRQRGQGVVEALLAAAALAACVHAIAWTARVQFHALEVSQAGRLAAFSAARARQAAEGDGATQIRLYQPAADTASGLSADAVRGQLASQWQHLDGTLLAARAQREVAPSGGWDSAWRVAEPLVLHRHTALAEQAGHASSDTQAQQRLTESTAGWGHAADTSLGLSRTLRKRAGNVDAAWGGRKPGDDWVSDWADLAPADRITKRK